MKAVMKSWSHGVFQYFFYLQYESRGAMESFSIFFYIKYEGPAFRLFLLVVVLVCMEGFKLGKYCDMENLAKEQSLLTVPQHTHFGLGVSLNKTVTTHIM